VSYETIGMWVRTFGPVFAQELGRRGRRPGDKVHLDEIALKINGRRYWFWRAVDQHGFVVDVLLQNRRDQHAAERLHSTGGGSVGLHAAGGHHRQARELPTCPAARAAGIGASSPQGVE
jgi:hypothetical protein